MTEAIAPTTLAAGYFAKACAILAKHGIAILAEKHDQTRLFREADLATLNEAFYEGLERQAAIIAELAKTRHDVATILAEHVADRQFHLVQRNYLFEAQREAMDERRRMLMFAKAGSYNAELTLGEIARVERSIRGMDPDDVMNLADMIGSIKTGDGPIRSKQPQDVLDLLLALGCIRFPPGQTRREGIITGERPRMGTGGQPIIPSQPHVSQLGVKINNVMRGYVNARRAEDARPPQR